MSPRRTSSDTFEKFSPVKMMSRSRQRSRTRSRRSRSRSAVLRSKLKNVKYGLVECNSNEVNIYWKYSIILIMFVIATLNIMTTLSFKDLMSKHEAACFIDTKIGHKSVLGVTGVCDYIVYGPLCVAVVALFWMDMFYRCGRGGYTVNKNHFSDRPWRIVMPALMCFTVISILEIFHVISLQAKLNTYCDRLHKSNDENEPKDCEYLNGIPSYQMFRYSTALTALLWLTATAIMLVRVLRAPDFRVVIHKATKVRIDPVVSHRQSVNCSNETLIFMSRGFESTRSVHFKRFSV